MQVPIYRLAVSTMNTATIITLIALGIMLVDACHIVPSVNGSCCEVKSNGFTIATSLKSRVYNITNFCGDCEVVAEGYCDAFADGGGWLVVQRRQDGSVDFNRGWTDYEEGFGSLNGEFLYGVRPLHCLINQGQWQLRIDFTLTNGTKLYLPYNKFSVGPANSQYQLSICDRICKTCIVHTSNFSILKIHKICCVHWTGMKLARIVVLLSLYVPYKFQICVPFLSHFMIL